MSHHHIHVPGFSVWSGDLLRSSAELVVCPVNCQPGVMGAGLARQFAHKFPGLRVRHRREVERGNLRIGRPVLLSACEADRDRPEELDGPPHDPARDVLLFPTKEHWCNAARYDWIFQGLAFTSHLLAPWRMKHHRVTLAFPYLGCGLGGLDHDQVEAMLRAWAIGIPERFQVHLYQPFEDSHEQ